MNIPAQKQKIQYPPIHRPRKLRDLERAVWLRPRDIAEIYGIPTSTLHELCTEKRGGKILPSVLIPSKNGRKGIRLVKRSELDAFLESHRVKPPTGP